MESARRTCACGRNDRPCVGVAFGAAFARVDAAVTSVAEDARASGSSARGFATSRSMHHCATHPCDALCSSQPLSIRVPVRDGWARCPESRSLRWSRVPAPPFARWGPLGRLPHVIAPTAALRLLAAHPAALRFLRLAVPPQFSGRRRRGLPSSSATLVRRVLRFFDPGGASGAAPPGPAVPTCRSSGVAFRAYCLVGLHDFDISGPDSAARVLAVYVVTVARVLAHDHARLASGWRSCLRRAGLLPAGSRNQVSAHAGSTWLPPGRSFAWRTVSHRNGIARARSRRDDATERCLAANAVAFPSKVSKVERRPNWRREVHRRVHAIPGVLDGGALGVSSRPPT